MWFRSSLVIPESVADPDYPFERGNNFLSRLCSLSRVGRPAASLAAANRRASANGGSAGPAPPPFLFRSHSFFHCAPFPPLFSFHPLEVESNFYNNDAALVRKLWQYFVQITWQIISDMRWPHITHYVWSWYSQEHLGDGNCDGFHRRRTAVFHNGEIHKGWIMNCVKWDRTSGSGRRKSPVGSRGRAPKRESVGRIPLTLKQNVKLRVQLFSFSCTLFWFHEYSSTNWTVFLYNGGWTP